MTPFEARYMPQIGVLLLAFAVVYGHDWEVHGSQKNINGREIQKLGGSITDGQKTLGVDGMKAGDYKKGHVQVDTAIPGITSLHAHAGLSGDNVGNHGKNFGLGYQDQKNSATWNRELNGPVRADSYKIERNLWTSPDGKGAIGAYLQHDRNNFGRRNTGGGFSGSYSFGK